MDSACMASSIGEALEKGLPVIFTRDGRADVVCDPGQEREALELMEKLGLIKLIRPRNRDMTDEALLSLAGWSQDCISPLEITHQDGSRATGLAAQLVLDTLREQYEEDTEANRRT